LENGVGCETDVLKSSRPTTTRVADPPVFEVARDNSLRSEGGAEMPNVGQVILGLPETPVDNEEQGERSFAVGKPKLSELTRIVAVTGPQVERR
jgi:hypothetical protein